jgi:predicted esterase
MQPQPPSSTVMKVSLFVACVATQVIVADDVGKGCTEVPLSQCGTSWEDSCLKCGTKSDYDCEKCCPHCQQVTKGIYTYCECSGPGPTPPPGPDSWDEYQVAGMDVLSVTGGSNKSAYDKVVIMLHGGGGSGKDWEYNYQQGWFGNLSGLKYVFPTSAIASHVWFNTYKLPGCGLDDDCAYDIPSIQQSASNVAALIEHEKGLVGGDASRVYLAGFSEGAQLTGYMQIAKLDFALGGTIIMDGFPLPPLFDMPGHAPAEAKKNATYYGSDMKWMIWHGEDDPIFPCNFTVGYWNNILKTLGASATLKVEHTEPGMSHTLIKDEFDELIAFVRG